MKSAAQIVFSTCNKLHGPAKMILQKCIILADDLRAKSNVVPINSKAIGAPDFAFVLVYPERDPLFDTEHLCESVLRAVRSELEANGYKNFSLIIETAAWVGVTNAERAKKGAAPLGGGDPFLSGMKRHDD